MAEPFLAEIRIFPFNFAPFGWAFCNGQILSISQNAAVFSLLGTTYGGNGINTFALPNFEGSVPINPGQGPGLDPYILGQTGGSASVTLLQTQMPAHTHALSVSQSLARASEPSSGVALGRSADGLVAYASTVNSAELVSAGATQIGMTGGSQPHNNLMPYLALNFCIALQGIFPSRN